MKNLSFSRGVKASGMVFVLVLSIVSAIAFLAPVRTQGLVGNNNLPVDLPNYYHTGYAVEDIDASMAEFTNTLGVEWQTPLTVPLAIRLSDGSVKNATFTFVLSQNEAPPYIELVEVQSEGDHPWKANSQHSPTHIGYAVNDLAATSDALVAAGWERTATVHVPGVSAFIFAYHEGPGGIQIELVDRNFVPVAGVCPDTQFCQD